MKYSVSNIAWRRENDGEMYNFLCSAGIDGVEIAPTRLFENPYDRLEEAHQYAWMLKNKYNLEVPSMQSIWYGVSESLWGSDRDREYLAGYTKKAILFAESMGIKNLVFGCPRNRSRPRDAEDKPVREFFKAMGDFAARHGTTLSIEANPVIYNTNFLNYTRETCEFVREIDSPGLAVNIDMGTMIYNRENPHLVKTYKTLTNHIHISAPGLEIPAPCREYETLKKVLAKIDYRGFISLEMKNPGDLEKVKNRVLWLKNSF